LGIDVNRELNAAESLGRDRLLNRFANGIERDVALWRLDQHLAALAIA